jgi:hypothetical protein
MPIPILFFLSFSIPLFHPFAFPLLLSAGSGGNASSRFSLLHRGALPDAADDRRSK